MSRVPKSVLRLPLEKRAEIAFREAVEEVIGPSLSLEDLFLRAH